MGVALLFSEDFTKLGGPRVGFASDILLIAPFASALANVAVKKWGQGVHPLSISAVPMGLGALMVLPFARLAEADRPIHLSVRPVLAVLYLAVVGSAVAFTLYYWLRRRRRASR